MDAAGIVRETVERDSDCSDFEQEEPDDNGVALDADIGSTKVDAAIETKLRRDYGVTELEADGCPIQTFHIGGITRNFVVLPRSPHQRKGQRVRCICQHVERVSIVPL
jgi:hypothetical protein